MTEARLRGGCLGVDLGDEPGELIWLVAEASSESHELAGLGDEFGLFGCCSGDGHAPALAELQQALIAKCAQCTRTVFALTPRRLQGPFDR